MLPTARFRTATGRTPLHMRNGEGKEIELEQAHFQAVLEAFCTEKTSPNRIEKCHQINKIPTASTSHHSILPHRSHPLSRRRRFFLFALSARLTQLQLPYCNKLRQSVCGYQQIHASSAPYQTARSRGRLSGNIRRRCHQAGQKWCSRRWWERGEERKFRQNRVQLPTCWGVDEGCQSAGQA